MRIKLLKIVLFIFIVSFFLLMSFSENTLKKMILSFKGENEINIRRHNIDLMHHVLKKDAYNGYDIIITTASEEAEADYQERILEKAFAGTTKKDGLAPIILSVVDCCEAGQLIGCVYTWLQAEEKMFRKYPELMKGCHTFLDYIRKHGCKVAFFHDGGKGERCSPLTQSLGNSRGAQKLVGSVTNALGEEIELNVLLGVILQCSSFAVTNPGTHIDTFWTSQIAFGSKSHEKLKRSNFAIDKFLVGFDANNLNAQNIADFGTAALSSQGTLTAFYGNKRFATRKGQQYFLDYPKIKSELFARGERYAYDFGSFSVRFDMWELIVDFWKKKEIFQRMKMTQKSSKIKRDIDPHFIQPLMRFLYGINLLNREVFDELFSSTEKIQTQSEIQFAREKLEAFLKEFAPQVYSFIWADIVNESNDKKGADGRDCLNEVIEFYLLYRNSPPFANLKKVFGYIDLGNGTQWFRYRRPVDIMNEKFEMLTDLLGKKIEVQLNGSVRFLEAQFDELQRSHEARLMRKIPNHEIAKFKVGEKSISLSLDEVKAGIEIEGVYVKNCIIQNSRLLKGTKVVNSVLNNVEGLVITDHSYIESSTSPFIEAITSVVHQVNDIKSIKADCEVVSDVYKTKIQPSYHGRMRAPIGYDPKGTSIYKNSEQAGNITTINNDTFDEIVKNFIEKIPYDIKGIKELSEKTIRTEDGFYTFAEIREIEPQGLADRDFKDSVEKKVKQELSTKIVFSH